MPLGSGARGFLAVAAVVSLLVAPVAYADSPGASTHVVQPGETLSDIAASVGVDSATLVALNSLDDANVLGVGQSIKLPDRKSVV
jgi:LysM repeat protein